MFIRIFEWMNGRMDPFLDSIIFFAQISVPLVKIKTMRRISCPLLLRRSWNHNSLIFKLVEYICYLWVKSKRVGSLGLQENRMARGVPLKIVQSPFGAVRNSVRMFPGRSYLYELADSCYLSHLTSDISIRTLLSFSILAEGKTDWNGGPTSKGRTNIIPAAPSPSPNFNPRFLYTWW